VLKEPLANWDPQTVSRMLAGEDRHTADRILGVDRGGIFREPDLIIAPDGKPYLYRWHVIPQNDQGNVYFHIQVDSDPERPLHDHPWDNTSVILSGGYEEIWDPRPGDKLFSLHRRRFLHKGDVIHRLATEAHRLILPPTLFYTMTLFSTGPKIRPWGFWFQDGWRPASEVTHLDPATRTSVMTEEAQHDARTTST